MRACSENIVGGAEGKWLKLGMYKQYDPAFGKSFDGHLDGDVGTSDMGLLTRRMQQSWH
jgi:hypothetical protein